MEKIIRNFITNAVKFSPYGGNVTIRLLACLEPRQEQEETTADLLPQQRKQLLQHLLPHQQHIEELRSCVQGFSAEALAVTQIFLHPYRSCSRLRDWWGRLFFEPLLIECLFSSLLYLLQEEKPRLFQQFL
jgi:hypothetical protein